MAKQLHLVTTLAEMKDYAMASYQAATKPGCWSSAGRPCYCPTAAKKYLAIAQEITNNPAAGGPHYKLQMGFINDECNKEAAARAATGPTKPGVKPPASIQDEAKYVVSNVSSFPWWLWVVGGAALYLIFGKKKGKK